MSLEVTEVTFRYGKKEPAVLEAFSAFFEKGEIAAILGPNGAGKTTLGKVIMGILKPEAGKILLDGQDLQDWSLAERGRKIGYAMQNPARQIFSPTVREEIAYGLENLGLSEQEIQEKSQAFLSLFGLDGMEEKFPFRLSHGEKQRLVLASILAMEPEYLLLDEPTSGLDQKRKAQLGHYLDRICGELGCGVLLISHDLGFVERYAKRTLTLGGDSHA